ncbi:MAG: peptidylprolyl isomerase [Planctomycetota bacterium]|nr:peptidylprolyl isomerase [Planctomycetota bacterium]
MRFFQFPRFYTLCPLCFDPIFKTPETCFLRSPIIGLVICAVALFLPLDPEQFLSAQTGIAATVGSDAIQVDRLQLQVDLVLAKTPAKDFQLDLIKAQVLEENIKQRLVNLYLKNSKFKATAAEVDLEIENLKKELSEQKSSLEIYLATRKITESQLKTSLGWDISWGKYLNNFLTEENLKKYFDQHRRKIDGTELRVSHILIQPENGNQKESWEEAFRRAKKIYADLASKKITFEKAVIEHSSGATKINKGELGWINWHGPMAPEFTVTSFQLKPGQISKPVSTSFGFHLIKLLEEKPGKTKMEAVRPQIVHSVKRYLFEWLAQKQAKQTSVKFTGNFPYFEFGSKKLGKYK